MLLTALAALSSSLITTLLFRFFGIMALSVLTADSLIAGMRPERVAFPWVAMFEASDTMEFELFCTDKIFLFSMAPRLGM